MRPSQLLIVVIQATMDVDQDASPDDDEPIIEEPDDDVRSAPEPTPASQPAGVADGVPDWGAMLGSA